MTLLDTRIRLSVYENVTIDKQQVRCKRNELCNEQERKFVQSHSQTDREEEEEVLHDLSQEAS